MRLVQLVLENGERGVAVSDPAGPCLVKGVRTVYALAQQAISEGETLAQVVAAYGRGQPVDFDAALAEGRVLAPIDHPDPAHLLLTGTGLTHLGSADARDRMHKAATQVGNSAEHLTNSMKMFRMGLEGGKPEPGETGAQPEWFYKGDGSSVVAPEASFQSPHFALDGGEEPEIVGIYVIGPNGEPCRLGFALGNEFSDHVTERQNYLFLAHSKLRNASFGPELRLGELPHDIQGVSRIRRCGKTIWEKPFLSGEANMSHAIANLEHHHFKYAQFRRPGDVHVHFFGAATLSFNDDVKALPGDVFEIEVEAFGRPLRNALAIAPVLQAVVRSL